MIPTTTSPGPAAPIPVPFAWPQQQDTLIRWAKLVGLMAVWSRENAPRPSDPYIALKVTQGPTPLGDDERIKMYDAPTKKMGYNVSGPREFHVNVQAFTHNDNPDPSMLASGTWAQWTDSAGYLSLLAAYLRSPDVLADLMANDIATIDVSPIQVLDDIALGRLQSRSSMDVRFYLGSNLTITPSLSKVTTIASTQITGTPPAATQTIIVGP